MKKWNDIEMDSKEHLYKVAYNNGFRDGKIAGMRKIEKMVNFIISRKSDRRTK